MVFIVFSLPIVVHAQSRFPIDATSVWRVDHITNGISNETKHEPGDDIFKYYLDGDTLIGSKTYFKIYKSGTSYQDVPFSYENIYCGALRDENNKFFLVRKNETKELLLYNFNAKTDDTIQVPSYGMFIEKIVSSVDTLPDGRRIIHFNPKEPRTGCGDQYIIEGIGGSGGLFEGPACFHFMSYDNHLVCYVQNDILLYHNNYFEFNCEIINHNNENLFDSTCIWRIDKQMKSDTADNFEKFQYFICGDTTIEANDYLKVCKSGIQLYIKDNGEYFSGVNDASYVGCLRETNKEIYFIERDKQNEILLYNFNLKKGEVVNGRIYSKDTVKNTSVVLENRTVFYLSDDYWQNFIIEGIGSENGLLEEKNENSRLVCFTKNNASLYHNGPGAECILTFDTVYFPECDKIKIIPANPTYNDEIKIIFRVGFQVSNSNTIVPFLSGNPVKLEEKNFSIDLFYNFDDRNNDDNIKIYIPVFDTINLGKISEGDYFIDTYVHTIHTGKIADTSFYDKRMYSSFMVSSPAGKLQKEAEKNCKVYPVPSNNYVMVQNEDLSNKIETIELFNVLGELVETVKVGDNSPVKVDLENVRKGIYILRVGYQGFSITKKIVKE